MNTVNISVFYNKSQWRELIQECLSPLLDRLLQNSTTEDYSLVISFERGDHIKLVICMEDSDSRLVKYCVHFIKSWIKINSSSLENSVRRKLYLWMNYDNNSVHVNAFSTKSYDQLFAANYLVRNALARQVSCFLINNPNFELDDLLTMVMSLGIITVSVRPSLDLTYELDKIIVLIKSKSDIDLTEAEYIINSFENNKDTLLSFYENAASVTENLEKEWLALIRDDNALVFSDTSDHIEITINILRSINACFGLSPALEIYTLTFVYKLLLLALQR